MSLSVDQGVVRGEEPVLTHKRTLRLDIQALRGVAILWVVLHHIRMPGVPGGFLGVDIFFVISGYLMTGLIDEALDDGRFTLRSFYVRRIRRILPAAYVTLTVTAIAAAFLIDAKEYHDLVRQIAGAFTFTVNMVLWRQTDYFGSGAELKPLLHTWSLSIEEQFYIVLPVVLMLLRTRWRLPAVLALVVASLALCLYGQPRSPSAAFYLLPTRAWELGIGSIVALAVRRGVARPAPMVALRLACVAVLAIVPLVVGEAAHPGWPALAVCLATGLLLVPGAESPRLARAVAPLTWIGDRSYSLYLVHWPILAFTYNIFLDRPPLALTLALVVPMLIWTELQYRFVEQPLRRFPVNAKTLGLLVLVPVIVIGGAYAWSRHVAPGAPDRAANFGLSPACEYKASFAPRPGCTTGASPKILLWGDSFAMHVAPGLAASSAEPIVQATRTVCGPFLGLAVTNHAQTLSWAASCMAFNDSVLAYLKRTPSIKTVVLSSPFTQYLPGADPEVWRMAVRGPDGLGERDSDANELAKGLQRTVDAIHATGHRVALVGPPPSIAADMSRCLDRRRLGLPTIGANPACTFTRADYQEARRPVLAFLDTITQRRILPILRLDPVLCASGTCRTTLDGTPLYRDHAHLSVTGSRLLGQRMHWADWVEREAR